MTYKKVVLFLLAISSFNLLAPARVVPQAQRRVRQYIELRRAPSNLQRFLSNNNVDLNYVYPDGKTILTIAALSANQGALEVLLNKGADPHQIVRDGKNVLELVNEKQDSDLYTSIRNLLNHAMNPRPRPRATVQSDIVYR